MVRMLPPGQPQVRYLVPAGRLQLPARAYPGHETVQPHAQQRTWMVGWRSQHLPVYLHPKLPPVLPVQSVNELGHEPRRMVQRQQLVKRRRQHPHLLSAHRSKRHISISPTGVASKVHPTTYPLPAQTSETGSNGRVQGRHIGLPKGLGSLAGVCPDEMLPLRLIRLKTLDSPDKSGRIGGGCPPSRWPSGRGRTGGIKALVINDVNKATATRGGTSSVSLHKGLRVGPRG